MQYQPGEWPKSSNRLIITHVLILFKGNYLQKIEVIIVTSSQTTTNQKQKVLFFTSLNRSYFVSRKTQQYFPAGAYEKQQCPISCLGSSTLWMIPHLSFSLYSVPIENMINPYPHEKLLLKVIVWNTQWQKRSTKCFIINNHFNDW